MGRIAIVIHGGAGGDSEFIREHEKEYHKALRDAAEAGYEVLEKEGSALDAVEEAIRFLEDCPLFNAGKGSALTEMGHAEMCASIMDGSNLNSGGVAIVRNVKNPISLARAVMEKTDHIYLGESGAMDFAREIDYEMMPDYYFVTEHQVEDLKKEREKDEKEKTRKHGTVGASACDRKGNIAAGTSTGGLVNNKEGRIADASMVGVGSYANNKTCAVSCTGDGEYTIRGVAAHDVSAVMEYKGLDLQKACDFVIHEKNKDIDGDLGLIAVDREGNVAFSFNSERMHRAWRQEGDKAETGIYR
jgi:L-asparaginase / beta-aspartyl-peptidase